MKIINYFDEEELKIMKKVDIEIESKNYTFDEISAIKNDFNYRAYNLKGSRKIDNKLIKCQKEFKEFFDETTWKCQKAYRATELNKILEKMDFLNKKLVSINATGNDIYLSKDSMLTCYNNSKELMKNDNWDFMKKITENYIPDYIERSRITSMNTPIILNFEDGTSLELMIKDISKMYLSENKLKNNYKYNIDIEKLFSKVLNHNINSYQIIKLEKGSTQFSHMDKRIICDDNFYGLYLCFDNGYELYFFNSKFIALCKNKEVLPVTIGEWKKSVKHYDWLFSRKAELKYTGQPKGELSKIQKDLISIFNQIGMSKGDVIHTMVLLNARNNEERMMNYLLDCYEKGQLNNLTDQDIMEKALNLIGKNNTKKGNNLCFSL